MSRLIVLMLVTSSALSAQNGSVASRPIVLRNVTVIDVEAANADRASKGDQSVLVIGNRIAAVGKDIQVPASATVVDGRGKFLIPGLWDMHVHIVDPSYFAMFIGNGVTGVRDMGGGAVDTGDGCESMDVSLLFDWRRMILAGEWIGPRVMVSGPVANGTSGRGSLPVRTEDEARAAVDSLSALGVDFVKVYEKVPMEAYRTLLLQAKKSGLPVAGHVPVDVVTPVQAAELGQRSIEHVRDHLLTCFTSDRDELLRFFEADHWSPSDIEWGLARHDECPVAVRAFRKHSTWLVPTLTVERSKVAVEESAFIQDPARLLLPRSVQAAFTAYAREKLAQDPSDRASERLWWETQKRLVAEMHRQKVGILAGTDAACQGGIPGRSLHKEMQLLVETGLTPFEALRTATINPALYFGLGSELGAIRPGYIADLVLLNRNPVEDIRNAMSIEAVVVEGRLLHRRDLDAAVKRRTASHNQ